MKSEILQISQGVQNVLIIVHICKSVKFSLSNMLKFSHTVYPIYFSGFIDYNWEEWECISCVQKATNSAEQLANPIVTDGIEYDRALMW